MGVTVSSSPAIGADGTLYVPGGCFYALNGSGGTLLWTSLSDMSNTPAIGVGETLYVESDNGDVCTLDGANGAIKWKRTTGGAVSSQAL